MLDLAQNSPPKVKIPIPSIIIIVPQWRKTKHLVYNSLYKQIQV